MCMLKSDCEKAMRYEFKGCGMKKKKQGENPLCGAKTEALTRRKTDLTMSAQGEEVNGKEKDPHQSTTTAKHTSNKCFKNLIMLPQTCARSFLLSS